MPSVDISSGTVSGGTIQVGHTFEFSTSATGSISVTVPDNGAWFSPSPASFTGPGSVTVTAELASQTGWGFGVTGMERSNTNPRIPVGTSMPHRKAG
jgi:hypothetical protein